MPHQSTDKSIPCRTDDCGTGLKLLSQETYLDLPENAKSQFMKIPHAKLSQAALREVIQEFVTRDGTDNSTFKQRMTDVLHQLENGSVELHFDVQTNTCNIVPVAT